MRVVLERLECNLWNLHIRVLDEADWVREILPKAKAIWERREEATPYLVLSILGFPIGVLVGYLTVVFR
jgi:hypothetical protein